MGEYEKKCEEARSAAITDGKTAFRYLPLYAEHETKYGTKQCYEDVFRKLKGVPEAGRDSWYLLALMETKQNMIETMFEYHDGIRKLFKQTFAVQSKRYNGMEMAEKAAYLAAAYLACENKTLLSHKYLPDLEKKYGEAAAEEMKNIEEWRMFEVIKQCYKGGTRV